MLFIISYIRWVLLTYIYKRRGEAYMREVCALLHCKDNNDWCFHLQDGYDMLVLSFLWCMCYWLGCKVTSALAFSCIFAFDVVYIVLTPQYVNHVSIYKIHFVQYIKTYLVFLETTFCHFSWTVSDFNLNSPKESTLWDYSPFNLISQFFYQWS